MKSIWTILIVLLSTVLLLEILLRIVASFPTDSPLFVNDVDIGYRMRPDVLIKDNLTTNSFGFNDIEHNRHKGEGINRVAFIGDSFVFGAVPRNQNFTSVVQRMADQSDMRIEVLNMGISAAEPANYLALLRNDAVRMNTDIVYVVFFVGNDIIQSHPDFTTRVLFGSTREVLRSPYRLGFSREYFYVYRALRSVTRLLTERLDKTPRESFTRANFLAVEYQRSGIYKINADPLTRQSYTGAIKILKEIANQAALLKKQLVIVIAPDELQINNALKSALLTEYDLNSDDYDFQQPQRIISKQLLAAGIEMIDLLPAFRKSGEEKTLYINQDTHWNAAGNLLAAETIWTDLEKNRATVKVTRNK